MPDDKDSKEKAAEKAVKKFAEKYETPEELEKAYVALNKKMSEQGGELGTLRKQQEQYQAALQQYAAAVQQYQPVMEWYTANQANLGQYGQWLQARQNGQTQQGPANQAINQGALSLLTPDEQRQLIGQAVQEFQKSVFDPWRQQFDKQLTTIADQRAAAVQGTTDERLKAYTEVLWRTFQNAFPKDTVDKLRNWHERSLRYADKQFDPMVAAQEELDLQAQLDEYKTKSTELQKQLEERDKQLTPSLGRTDATVDWAKKPDAGPVDKNDRYQRVMNDTIEKSGREAVRDLFPGGVR